LGSRRVVERMALVSLSSQAREIGQGPPRKHWLSEASDCHCSTTRASAKPAALSTSLPLLPMPADPDLTLPLAQPITLTRGPGSHLVTLMDVAILIGNLEPFRQARPVWDRVAEMILIAAETGRPDELVGGFVDVVWSERKAAPKIGT